MFIYFKLTKMSIENYTTHQFDIIFKIKIIVASFL